MFKEVAQQRSVFFVVKILISSKFVLSNTIFAKVFLGGMVLIRRWLRWALKTKSRALEHWRKYERAARVEKCDK